MTGEAWEALPVHERDTALAERVLGWRRVQSSLAGVLWDGTRARGMLDFAELRRQQFGLRTNPPLLWSAHTRVADAWDLVGAARTAGWRVAVIGGDAYRSGPYWRCNLEQPGPMGERYHAMAREPGEAVCRAVAQAYGLLDRDPAAMIGALPWVVEAAP